jgi:hypothetical protein
MKRFLKKVFTLKNLNRIITIFIIGITLRYFINDYLNTNILEYIDYISIIVGSALNSFLIEPLLIFHCELYGYKFIAYINDNNKSNLTDINSNLNLSSHYYDIQGRISLSKPSELLNYDFDTVTRKKVVSQIFEEIAQPPKFKEVLIPSENGTGQIYLGIRYYDKASNPVGLYVKYYNLFNQMYY